MTEVVLRALEGTNPLGFLAALGALDATARSGRRATLRWTDDIVPQAMLGGIEDTDDLLEVLDEDRQSWAQSLVLRYPKTKPLTDAKPDESVLRDWFKSAYAGGRAVDADMLCSIVAEGAFDRASKAKPTHLHFTAGQQQFLEMVRTLATDVSKDMLKEAIDGPWAYKSPLPSLSWDARGERLYAVRATNPSGEKRLGVPGADWLAFRGLIFYPVSSVDGSLRTTGCDRAWKHSAFRWPLWSVPASRDVVWSLVGDRSLVSERWPNGQRRTQPRDLAARGISRVMESPIRRSDQGGYGSFSGSVTLASA
jgi:hypothetical protein